MKLKKTLKSYSYSSRLKSRVQSLSSKVSKLRKEFKKDSSHEEILAKLLEAERLLAEAREEYRGASLAQTLIS